MMSVGLTNEGPVTFTLDSRPYEYISATATPTGASRSGSSTPVEVPKASRQSTSAKSTAAAAVAQRNAEKALRKAAWDAKKRQGGGSSASNEAKSVEDIGEGNNDTVVEQVIKASTV